MNSRCFPQWHHLTMVTSSNHSDVIWPWWHYLTSDAIWPYWYNLTTVMSFWPWWHHLTILMSSDHGDIFWPQWCHLTMVTSSDHMDVIWWWRHHLTTWMSFDYVDIIWPQWCHLTMATSSDHSEVIWPWQHHLTTCSDVTIWDVDHSDVIWPQSCHCCHSDTIRQTGMSCWSQWLQTGSCLANVQTEGAHPFNWCKGVGGQHVLVCASGAVVLAVKPSSCTQASCPKNKSTLVRPNTYGNVSVRPNIMV